MKFFRIFIEVIDLIGLFIVTMIVVFLAGVFVLALNLRNFFYRMIGKKRK